MTEIRPHHGVTFAEALRAWIKISLLSFGGPAGQIAVMHRTLVEEKQWMSESRFLHALNYCMLLPGPEAQQLAAARVAGRPGRRISFRYSRIFSHPDTKRALCGIPGIHYR